MSFNLTSEEMTACFRSAREKLPEEEKKKIDQLVKKLIKAMKKKYPNCQFGPDSALELLAVVGMGINDNRIRFR